MLQIGSPKGVARLLQRAGRSGHAPGRASRVTLVPTNTLELVEAAAARSALREGRIESRRAPERPLDVLVQHLVTIALGTGFIEDELLAEVRDTWSYRALSDEDWQWALDFVGRGGEALRAYPDYQRVSRDADGVYRVDNARIGQRHRMSIGTIVSEASMLIKTMNGRDVGVMEESFISRLRKGDTFLFGGRVLELVRVHEMTAYVRAAKNRQGAVPRWAGSKMPLSSEMADAALRELEGALDGTLRSPRDAARTAADRAAGQMVEGANARHTCRRIDALARRTTLVRLSVRGTPRSHRARIAARVPHRPRHAFDVFNLDERLRF